MKGFWFVRYPVAQKVDIYILRIYIPWIPGSPRWAGNDATQAILLEEASPLLGMIT